MRRQRLDVDQGTVDAISHARTVFRRLYVDIRSASLRRARDQIVDRADNGSIAGEVLEPFDVGLVDRLRVGLNLGGGAIKPVQCRFDVIGLGDFRTNFALKRKCQRLDRIGIEGIDQRHIDGLVRFRDRYGLHLPQEARRDCIAQDPF